MLAFAARGDRLALIARGRAGLQAAVREAKHAGAAKAIAVEADVADPEAIEAAAQRIEEELGPIDVWVNDAFASVFAPFTEISPRSSGGSPRSPIWDTCTPPARRLPGCCPATRV